MIEGSRSLRPKNVSRGSTGIFSDRLSGDENFVSHDGAAHCNYF